MLSNNDNSKNLQGMSMKNCKADEYFQITTSKNLDREKTGAVFLLSIQQMILQNTG